MTTTNEHTERADLIRKASETMRKTRHSVAFHAHLTPEEKYALSAPILDAEIDLRLCAALLEAQRPIDMVLYCPKCGTQHIDAPDDRTPDWTNPPHKSHLCHGCGHIWRPSDTPTNGVERTASGKDADTAPAQQPALKPLTDGEKRGLFTAAYEKRLVHYESYLQGIEDGEAAHGITGEAQPAADDKAGGEPVAWREFLARMEWSDWRYDRHGRGRAHCPDCYNQKEDGHSEDCELSAMLAAAPKPQEAGPCDCGLQPQDDLPAILKKQAS